MHRALSTVAVALVLVACADERTVSLGGSMQLSAGERRTVASAKPLDASAPFAEACILPAPEQRIRTDAPYSFVTVDGKQFVPIVAMVGAKGDADPFTNLSLLRTSEGGTWLCFSAPGQKPHAPYQAASIESPAPLLVAAVRWQNFDK